MDGGCLDAVGIELRGKSVGRMLHAGKDKHLIPIALSNQIAKKFALALFGNLPDLLIDERVLFVAGNFNFCRSVEKGLRQRTDFVVEGCREHQRLAFGGQPLDDFFDVVNKAHVKHAVCLIEHEKFDCVELNVLLTEVIEQAAGRGNEKVCSCGKRINLGLHVDAAENKRRREHRAGGISADVFINLSGKLPRGSKNQRADAFA